ncbi:MAG: helix-turn-helix transcriptional regulator [Proteobacteria bacterium]|nr:helix-turn-helix transcriptional regulator [Pseudomonadota bacterium]
METIGKRLRRFREASGLSVAKVAAYVGVSESTYRDWEQGRAIQGEPYPRLAEIFAVGLTEVIVGERSDKDWIFAELEQIERIIRIVRNRL